MKRCYGYECEGEGFYYYDIVNYIMKVTEDPELGKCFDCEIFQKRHVKDYPDFNPRIVKELFPLCNYRR
jgi:hypothetical protein